MDKTTGALSRYVTSLRYEDLSPRAVHETKRHLIDSLGCAIGGYGSEPSVITRRLAPAWSGSPCARILGEGRSTTPEAAAFANSVMIRFLDANDTYITRGSGHPSDMLGALIAAADSQGASGKDLVLATIAGYEVFGALADQVPLRDRGWDQGVFVAPASAAGAGLLLGLSAEQVADALAIAATANVATRQTRAGDLSMWKGCATAVAAKAGLFAAQLAKEGMTGPTAAFEGRHGLWEQVTGPSSSARSAAAAQPFAIERTNFKSFATEYHAQAPVAMALALEEKSVEQIEAIACASTPWPTARSQRAREVGSENPRDGRPQPAVHAGRRADRRPRRSRQLRARAVSGPRSATAHEPHPRRPARGVHAPLPRRARVRDRSGHALGRAPRRARPVSQGPRAHPHDGRRVVAKFHDLSDDALGRARRAPRSDGSGSWRKHRGSARCWTC